MTYRPRFWPHLCGILSHLERTRNETNADVDCALDDGVRRQLDTDRTKRAPDAHADVVFAHWARLLSSWWRDHGGLGHHRGRAECREGHEQQQRRGLRPPQ